MAKIIMQRQLIDECGRLLWFDSGSFNDREKADHALRVAREEQKVMNPDGSFRREQKIRLIGEL